MTEFLRSPTLQKLLMSKGRKLKIAKGEALGSSDDKQDVILVVKGFVKRYSITGEGSLGVQIVYGEYDVFPLTLVYRVLLQQELYIGPEIFHYKAMSDATIYALDPETFAQCVLDDPAIYQDLFSEAGQHLATTIQRLENMTLKSSYERVAHILLFYARKFGHDVAAGVRIPMPLTHQDIADVLSVSRETVSMAMVKLSKKKVIKSGRYIIVPDIDRLSQEAFSEADS